MFMSFHMAWPVACHIKSGQWWCPSRLACSGLRLPLLPRVTYVGVLYTAVIAHSCVDGVVPREVICDVA